MVNISVVLKDMVRRLAKKEVKANTSKTKQAVARYRRDIALLKRELQSQAKEITFLKAQEQKRLVQPTAEEESAENARFSPRSVRSQRKRLKLSAADYGKLVGVSGLTIYHWESGKSRPRKAQLAALVAVRGIGKREALAKLAALGGGKPQPAKRRRKPRRRTG